MNDCFWYSIGVCDGDGKCNCEKYISMNSKVGESVRIGYQKEIDNAINPIREAWQHEFDKYES